MAGSNRQSACGNRERQLMKVEAIEKARKYLEKITPLKSDCGLLCGSLCCKKNDKDDSDNSDNFGMWLFPFEDELYKNNSNFKVIKADGNSSYPFLLCGYSGKENNFCKREERPLFCRFFPYFPIIKNRRIKIIIHPTALKMCPAISSKLKITSQFSRAVKKAVYLMLSQNDEEITQYLVETGEYLKSMAEFAGKILGFE